MPHISLKMLEGRAPAQKEKAAKALTEALKTALGIGDAYISLTIEDFTAEQWQSVFKSEVTDKKDFLYKKPDYDPKSLL